MAKNEAKIKFTAETGDFNKSIKQSNDEMSSLRAELRLNDEQMKTTGKSAEGLQRKQELLESQLKASENKTEALNKKLNKAVEIYGENSSEVLKLKTQVANAQTQEEKLKQAINNCNNELKEQKDDANDATEGFTVMKGAMAELAADGIEKVVSGLADISKETFTVANDIDKAMNSLVASTGASKESTDELEESMLNIYNGNYGESFEDIASSMAQMKQVFGDGISTEGIEKLTTDALILRDTFDMDVNESIRAINSLMDQFGLDGEEAYNLIAQGAQNGLNQNGDLLDVINEYSVQFAKLGFSSEDMFNSLANGVDNGTWSVDKLGDAMKEFSIRAIDGSDATMSAFKTLGYGASGADKEVVSLEKKINKLNTQIASTKDVAKKANLTKELSAAKNQLENIKKTSNDSNMSVDELMKTFADGGDNAKKAFEDIIKGLKDIKDPVERDLAGVSLFGTMWEDLGQDAVFAMVETQGEISKTKDSLSEINSVKYNDIGSAFEGIKRNLQTAIAEPMREEVMPVINDFVEDTDWDSVGETIGDVFANITKGAVAMANGVKAVISWMNQYKGVVIAIATVIGILTTAITAYNVVQGIKAAMEAANVTTVWALVSAHIAQAAAAMAAIAPYILIVAAIAAVIAIIVLCVKYWDKIVEAVKNCWEMLKNTLSEWGKWINDNVIQPVVNFFKDLWETITTACSDAWEGIKDAFSSFVSWVDTDVIQPVVNFFKDLWTAIKDVWDTICDVVQLAIMFIGSLIDGAVQIITLPFRFIWENCKEAVFTAWEWIKEKISTALNAIKNVISTVWNAIKNVFTTIFNVYKNIITTAWNAYIKVITTVLNAIKSVITKVFDAIKSVVSTVWNAIKNAISKAVNAIKNTISKVWNSIKTATSKAFNSVKTVASNVWNGIKNTISNVVNGIRKTVSDIWEALRSKTKVAFDKIKRVASDVFGKVKNAITKPIEAAKDKVKDVVDSIKGFFKNLKLKFPDIKMPHFKITGEFSIKKRTVPKLDIEWYAQGGIMTRPTIFGMNGDSLMAGGEAGPEAILPISKLEDYIDNAFQRNVAYAGATYNFYLDNATVNDNAKMRSVAKDFITEMVRLGRMNR